MDIGRVIEEGDRALPSVPLFPNVMPAKPPAVPATPAPVKAPEREKVPA